MLATRSRFALHRHIFCAAARASQIVGPCLRHAGAYLLALCGKSVRLVYRIDLRVRLLTLDGVGSSAHLI